MARLTTTRPIATTSLETRQETRGLVAATAGRRAAEQAGAVARRPCGSARTAGRRWPAGPVRRS